MKWVSRADWGARPATGVVHKVPASERTAFLSHYDGGSPIILPDHAACYEHVRKTQRFHQDGNGWTDIGYNTLGCPHGYVFEGRGLDAVGAHCPDFNRIGHGHQFMLGGDQEPTALAKAAAREVYDLQSKRSGNTLRKMGHQDGFATACPGPHVLSWVRAGMPGVATVQPPTEEEELMALTVKNPKTGEEWPLDKAIWSSWSYGINAARDAAATLAIVKAMAAKGTALTPAEIEAAAKAGAAAALEERIQSATVQLDVQE